VSKISGEMESAEAPQPQMGRLILQAYRAFADRAVAKLRERGYDRINLAHTTLLGSLDVEGTWITTLAERAGMTKQSMRQLAIDLEEKGYVKRTIDPQDKRATLVIFTDTGLRLMADVREIKQQMQIECADLLGVESMAIIEQGLNKLIDRYRLKDPS
jgi:DNA-binding MarR family transcriptional regulator